MQKILAVLLLIIGVSIAVLFLHNRFSIPQENTTVVVQATPTPLPTPTPVSPLAIGALREKSYPGSAITIEQTLSDGSNYHRFIVSYLSDGLTIYGLLTVPIGQKPLGGWPVIVINHGYIPPTEYSSVSSYASVVTPFASSGYIVFKPDYRGNGNSQGTPTQVYVSDGYVTDSLNALASIKKYTNGNPNKIGIWGHSMGGNITLHELVLPVQVQAVDIWSGVVGNYTDILSWWDKRVATGVLTTQNDLETDQLVNEFRSQHGTPSSNPAFWQAIDPTNYLQSVASPVFIQVGTADAVVPPNFSTSLYSSLKNVGKTVQLVTYPGADHNLAPDSASAMEASIAFFNKYLK